MKQLTLVSSKQAGFTLLESLIALVIFSIVVLGSATSISHMLHTQKDMKQSAVIINLMQNKLQKALNRTGGSQVCDAVNKDSFQVAQQTFYIACSTERVRVDSTTVDWPVLAVSTTQQNADTCAQSGDVSNCYVLGK